MLLAVVAIKSAELYFARYMGVAWPFLGLTFVDFEVGLGFRGRGWKAASHIVSHNPTPS